MFLKQFSWIFRRKFAKEDKDRGKLKERTAEQYLNDKISDLGSKSLIRHFTGIGFFIFGKIFHEFANFDLDGVQMLDKFDCFKESAKKKKKPWRFLDKCFHYFFDDDETKKAIKSVVNSADFHDSTEVGRMKMSHQERFLVVLIGLSAKLDANLVYQANDVHNGQEAAENARSPYPCMVLFHDRHQVESYNKIAV